MVPEVERSEVDRRLAMSGISSSPIALREVLLRASRDLRFAIQAAGRRFCLCGTAFAALETKAVAGQFRAKRPCSVQGRGDCRSRANRQGRDRGRSGGAGSLHCPAQRHSRTRLEH